MCKCQEAVKEAINWNVCQCGTVVDVFREMAQTLLVVACVIAVMTALGCFKN